MDRVINAKELRSSLPRIVERVRRGERFTVVYRSRPALRLFATYASWSDGLRGFVGGVPYANKTSGITYGVQVETWW